MVVNPFQLKVAKEAGLLFDEGKLEVLWEEVEDFERLKGFYQNTMERRTAHNKWIMAIREHFNNKHVRLHYPASMVKQQACRNLETAYKQYYENKKKENPTFVPQQHSFNTFRNYLHGRDANPGLQRKYKKC